MSDFPRLRGYSEQEDTHIQVCSYPQATRHTLFLHKSIAHKTDNSTHHGFTSQTGIQLRQVLYLFPYVACDDRRFVRFVRLDVPNRIADDLSDVNVSTGHHHHRTSSCRWFERTVWTVSAWHCLAACYVVAASYSVMDWFRDR